MAVQPVLVWFKHDLRLADHEPLWHACHTGQPVVAAVVVDARLFETTALGFPRMGHIRTRFLFESIRSLASELAARGGRLIIRYGDPATEIAGLVKSLGIASVYTAGEVAPEEVALLQRLRHVLNPLGAKLTTCHHHTLVRSEDLPWPVAQLPDVFTQFRKEVERACQVRAPLPVPATISFFNTDYPDHTLPAVPPAAEPASHPASVVTYGGGEPEARRRLHEYIWTCDALRTYKETRNGLLGANYSSKFSPALAVGTLSPRTIYHEVKRYEADRIANDSTYWLVFELLWRDYFQFVMQKFGSRVFHSRGLRPAPVVWRRDSVLFEQWRLGHTGVPFVDANMRELLHTGFMSNRGRQNVASYLTKDLHLDWRWGAAWFESQLIDYDVCSNWLNWAYVAGVGNDPREDRYFNIARQAERYDPQGAYVHAWLKN